MSERTRLTRHAMLATGIAATAALVLAGVAHADNINDAIADNGAGLILVAGDATSVGATTVKVVGANNDTEPGCNIDAGEQLGITFVTPAGVTASPASVTFTNCTSTLPVSFTAAAGAVGGTVTATITTNTTGSPASGYNNNVSIPITIQQPVKTSSAPITAVLPADAAGNEGSPLSTGGSFTDADGNSTLTVTKVSGAGAVTDNGDGSWSWSHTSTDDANGTVVVQASDGEHASVTESFGWTASNVAPSIGQVSSSRLGACAATVSAAFTDPGSADTHSAVINWGDGSTSTVDPATTPVAGSHTFGANGTYQVGVTVTDDDAGSDSRAAAASFVTQNTPSAIMQPINAAGTPSVFKLGSTIPVKITVTGCDGQAVSTLTPGVALTRIDNVAGTTVNESTAETVSTNGLAMRWSAPQYIYNLSSKLSQHTGAALTAGTYRVTVSDSSFTGPVSAQFDLRK
jgi:hypothetical protein